MAKNYSDGEMCILCDKYEVANESTGLCIICERNEDHAREAVAEKGQSRNFEEEHREAQESGEVFEGEEYIF